MTREEAWDLLIEYNKDEFHLQHAQIVENTMKYFCFYPDYLFAQRMQMPFVKVQMSVSGKKINIMLHVENLMICIHFLKYRQDN